MRAALHALLLFLGFTALVSGTMLMLHPLDGGAIQAPLSLLERTPFRDFFWPGLILAGLFGAGSLLTGLALARGWSLAFRMAQVIGAGQVVWILFQLVWFPEHSALQPIMAAIGLLIFVLAEACRRSQPAY